jgi:BirA family transcriptional regulator, biotin operon repressor / biotin---[acetyl-CoA-carboxylase] ligase
LKELPNFRAIREIKYLMVPKIAGVRIIRLNETGSTNDYLAELLKTDPEIENGTLVTAGYQDRGRGFGDHTWESEPMKNLLFSLYYKPHALNSHHQFYLNMAVSLAVQSFIRSVLPKQNITVKWPNDLYINDLKTGGLLLQHTVSGSRILHSIIGIGLNVNQLRFMSNAPNPVSLRHFLDHDLNIADCLNRICHELDRMLFLVDQNAFQAIKSGYLSVLYGLEVLRKYKYNEELIEARIKGVSDYGMLILEKRDGMRLECDMNEIKFIIDC